MHKDLTKLIHYNDDAILSKAIIKTDKKNVTLFCMAKGTELSEHTSTKEAMVHVIEGTGTFILKGKKIAMKPGMIILMDKNAKHSLKAEKNLSFILTFNI
ncbi:MAG: cupin domain-containing protein [Nanoarchaeota archaeon]